MRASIARSVGDARRQNGTDALLDAATHLHIKDFAIHRQRGKTIITGVARYQVDCDVFFEAVKQLDGWESDVVINLAVERHDVRGYHTVEPGETLASIAKRYLGSASRELDIFEANRDRMNDPDQICPGQQLLIPWR
jgi:nucleoid-associated protein YgaU